MTDADGESNSEIFGTNRAEETPSSSMKRRRTLRFFHGYKKDHFQNGVKPYSKRIDVFLRESDFAFVYGM